jgi:hypothetical protein
LGAPQAAKKESPSFLKKRSKRLLSPAASTSGLSRAAGCVAPWRRIASQVSGRTSRTPETDSGNKSLLVLFFRKEQNSALFVTAHEG